MMESTIQYKKLSCNLSIAYARWAFESYSCTRASFSFAMMIIKPGKNQKDTAIMSFAVSHIHTAVFTRIAYFCLRLYSLPYWVSWYMDGGRLSLPRSVAWNHRGLQFCCAIKVVMGEKWNKIECVKKTILCSYLCEAIFSATWLWSSNKIKVISIEKMKQFFVSNHLIFSYHIVGMVGQIESSMFARPARLIPPSERTSFLFCLISIFPLPR